MNARDKAGHTALMRAADEKNLAAVQALLALGADRTLRDEAGQTASSLAQAKGYQAIVETLLATSQADSR